MNINIAALRKGIILLLAAPVMFSCAKMESLDSKAIERNALEKWVEKYAPDAQLLREGVYYEVLQEAGPEARKVDTAQWVVCDYQVLDLDGNIVYTRDTLSAARLGTATKYTHYIPDFFIISSSESTTSIMKAQYYALTKMKKGDVWRLYAASQHIYGSSGLSNNTGYGGQYSLAGNKPGIVDNLRVIDIIDDPDIYEQLQVEEVAFSRKPMGWGLTEDDALMRHYYRQYLNPVRPPIKDTVPADSVARIYYKARFLDGFLFDTNIDSVWTNYFGGKRKHTSSSSGESTLVDDTTAIKLTRKVPYEVSTSMPNKVFSFLFAEEREDMMLRYGDSLRIVVTSVYAYNTGRPGYVYGEEDATYSYSTTYGYNSSYYGYGGYSYYGSGAYDYYNSGYYDYYNTSSTSYTSYPVAEIKEFTPLIYELVVLRPEGSNGTDDEDEESGG